MLFHFTSTNVQSETTTVNKQKQIDKKHHLRSIYVKLVVVEVVVLLIEVDLLTAGRTRKYICFLSVIIMASLRPGLNIERLIRVWEIDFTLLPEVCVCTVVERRTMWSFST